MVRSGESRSSPFAVTAATNTVRLDAQRKGVTTFTVSNASGRSLTGRAQLRVDQSVASSWLALTGEPERAFAANQSSQFDVEIAVPPDATAGQYTFSLDMTGVENPDEMFSLGPPVSIEVPEPVVEDGGLPKWWWMPVAVAVVLLIGGVGVFLAIRGDDEPPANQFSQTRRLTTSSPIDLDSPDAVTEASSKDDLQYIESGQNHIFGSVNNARIVTSGNTLTLDSCTQAARDQNADQGLVQLGAGSSATVCVETGADAISLVKLTVVAQGGGGGRPIVNENVLDVIDIRANELQRSIGPAGLDAINEAIRNPDRLPPLPSTLDVNVTYDTQPK